MRVMSGFRCESDKMAKMSNYEGEIGTISVKFLFIEMRNCVKKRRMSF